MTPGQVAQLRAEVAAGATHECSEWWTAGRCALCDRRRRWWDYRIYDPLTGDFVSDAQHDAIVVRLIGALQASAVPEHLRAGLVRYVADGILPGSFLQAVLVNDLTQAVLRADPSSLAGLSALVTLLVDHVPAVAWGSRTAVLAWTTTPDRLEI